MKSDRIIALISAQFAEMRRDFGATFLTFLFPLFFVIVLSASALIGATPSFEFGVLDRAQTQQAQGFVDALASQNVAVTTYADQAALDEALKQRDITAAVVVPEGWTPQGAAPVQVTSDADMAGLTATVLDAARARIGLGDGEGGRAMPYALATVEGGNSEFAFIYPGMLALALVQMGLFMTATPILKARERGTLRYLTLTPATTSELIASQIAFRVVVAALQLLLLLAVGSVIISLDWQTWLGVAGVSALGVVMLVSIGYALAGLVRSTESGMALIMIVNFAMMFGGNVFWNPENSTVLLAVAHVIPVSYLADAYRQLISEAPGLWPLWQDVAMMALFTLLAVLLALRSFSFDMRSPDLQPRRA